MTQNIFLSIAGALLGAILLTGFIGFDDFDLDPPVRLATVSYGAAR